MRTSSIQDPERYLAAVSFKSQQLSVSDLTIGAELTAAQLAVVKQRFATVALPKDYCPERLQSELIHTLLNPKAFTDAGHQFDKKLNEGVQEARRPLASPGPGVLPTYRR